MALTGLSAILGYSEQVPNWAPNERFLPNADYGRVGALKLAKNIFEGHIIDYIEARDIKPWGKLGQYHYYLLGKNISKRVNEFNRVSLTGAPTYNSFKYGNFDENIEINGPVMFQAVLDQISEASRIYGFSPQVLSSAILTLANGVILNPVTQTAPTLQNANFKDGFLMAGLNFGLLESLWGIRGSGFPQTYRRTPGGGFAAREGYGGGRKGKKRGRKGKRKRYY